MLAQLVGPTQTNAKARVIILLIAGPDNRLNRWAQLFILQASSAIPINGESLHSLNFNNF